MKLRVEKTFGDDVNKGIVRVDTKCLKDLGLKVGEIVQIEGKRKTVAIIDRIYPGDIGFYIIMMDSNTRLNAMAKVNEKVEVKLVDWPEEAKKLIIAPSRQGTVIEASPEAFKQGLLGRPFVKGDVLSLRTKEVVEGDSSDLLSKMDLKDRFVVVDTVPEGVVVVVDETKIFIELECADKTKCPDLKTQVKDILMDNLTYTELKDVQKSLNT